MSLKQRAFSGVVWSTYSQVLQQGMQFAFSILLARLLSPEDFGLVAAMMVFLSFGSMFADAGFASALIQKADLEERHTQSVFWLNMGIGFALALIFYIFAPAIAAFYHLPLLKALTRVSSLRFIINSFASIPSAMLQKHLSFEKLAKINVGAMLLANIIAVLLALYGLGVWSLVFQSLVSSALIAAFCLKFGPWRPKIQFSYRAIEELFHYTSNLFGFTFINFWARNSDNLLIGRVFGSAALGNYNRAYGLMLLPLSQIISVISNVMFSALSSIKHDRTRVKSIYLKATGVIALLAFPISVGMFVTAQPFVLTVYGAKWQEIIPILRILSLVGLSQAVCNPTGWIYTSQGRTDLMFWWGLGGAGTLILAIIIGVVLGSVEKVAVSYAIANFLLIYPCIALAGRLIDITIMDVLRVVIGPCCGVMIMAGAVYVLQLYIPVAWANWQQLVVQVVTGCIVYALFVISFKLDAWRDISQILRERTVNIA